LVLLIAGSDNVKPISAQPWDVAMRHTGTRNQVLNPVHKAHETEARIF
jgi:hypothetical protein